MKAFCSAHCGALSDHCKEDDDAWEQGRRHQSSRASPEGYHAAGRKCTGAPEEFPENEHADVKQQIAEEGAEGIVERHHEFCAWHRGRRSLENWGDASEWHLSCPKVGSVGVSFEQGGQFTDAEYEPRPAAACAAGSCPVSDRSADAGKRDRDRVCDQVRDRVRDRARENFSKHVVPFGGQPNVTSVQQLEVLEEEKLTRKNSHPRRRVKRKEGRLL
ncbi:hypothetical protein MRX96_034651 [Rhipicephalus microplus]